MKISNSFILASLALAFANSASAATPNAATQSYTQYSQFVTATAAQNTIANALDYFTATTDINSGNTINGITYSFDIYNRADLNQAHGTVGQVEYNAWSGFKPILTPPGIGTAFQPGSGIRDDKITLSFSAPINSFGVSLSIAPSSLFQIVTNAPSTSIYATIASYGDLGAGYAYGFLGLVSDSPFTSVTLSGGNKYQGRAGLAPYSGWDVTRVTYGTIPAVPEPSGLMLLLGGLIFMLGSTRRRYK